MTHEIKLTVNVKDSDEQIEISGTIGDNDWDILEAFVQYAVELISTKLVRNGIFASLQIRWEQGSTMKFGTKLPNWDDVIVFLHKLRPFVLQNEATFFYRVSNILKKIIEQPFLRSFIDEQRKIYSGQMMQEMVRISIDDIVLNSEKVLLDWLNAYEYHRDKNKKEFIDELNQMFPLDASKAIFLQLLSYKIDAIHNLTGFIRVLIREQPEFNLHPKEE